MCPYNFVELLQLNLDAHFFTEKSSQMQILPLLQPRFHVLMMNTATVTVNYSRLLQHCALRVDVNQ